MITAKSAIIVFLNRETAKENILYQKNSNQKLPIASLTKIMTAIIALENLNQDQLIKISKNSVMSDGNNGGLIIDEELSVKDLLYIMLIESSNDAATALAGDNPEITHDKFIDLMNKKAKELGLNTTSFSDPTGLDNNNRSSVLDLAMLGKKIIEIPLLLDIITTKEITLYSWDKKIVHNLKTTNKLFGRNLAILGGKTGYTTEAGGCMLTIFKINDNYLIGVVLGSENREDDTEKLIDWAQNAWLWK